MRFLTAMVALLLLGTGAAIAGPSTHPLATESLAVEVQMRCTPSSCIDMQTGVYTQSTCDQFGCRPLGGAVGRLGPGGYDQPRYRDNQYGQFDCSPTRCVDTNTGRVFESTCDYGGCRPLRPARRQYY